MLLSVIIPAYNEEENISILINRLVAQLDNINFELIFVDDASTDGTLSLVENICKSLCIKLISISENTHIGQHACIRHGIFFAHGIYTCVMSADLQEPVQLILKMLEKSIAGADLVIAVREKRRDHVVTDLFAKFFNLFLHCFVAQNFPKAGFDFYIFNSTLRKQIDLDIHHFSYPQLDLINCAKNIDYTTYTRIPRIYGKTKWSFFKRAKLALHIVYKYFIFRFF